MEPAARLRLNVAGVNRLACTLRASRPLVAGNHRRRPLSHALCTSAKTDTRPVSERTRRPSSQECRQIPHDLFGLGGHVGPGYGSGDGTQRDLTREKQKISRSDCRRIRSDGSWRVRKGDGSPVRHAAFVIFPLRRQRVQTRIRRVAPLTSARTRWRFGSNLRSPTLWA